MSTASIHPGEDHHKVNQNMGLFTYFSLCFLGLLIANPFLEAEADTCAREWLQNQGNCYAYFDHKLTWQEAELWPWSSSHLYPHQSWWLSISLLVAEHISTYQRDLSNVWIGLHDVHQTGRWRWADESTYNYKAWMKNQPDSYGNAEHCVELRLSTGRTFHLYIFKNEWLGQKYQLSCFLCFRFKGGNDSPCQKRNAYICKHEL
ncbi:hypothetical protein NXF25_021101 [Crotalus adamanteus]|uniref:C-type lectin domain-containing protein n=1 Tax=Crotalus adamanteus TaxID=8729 RepID=A0AAW1B6I4_CROAD